MLEGNRRGEADRRCSVTPAIAETNALPYREIEGDDTAVMLVIQRRRAGSTTGAVGDLHRLFVEQAQAHPAAV